MPVNAGIGGNFDVVLSPKEIAQELVRIAHASRDAVNSGQYARKL